MSAVEDLSRRRGGREARRALRSRPIPMAEAAVRPGMEGGQYKPLTEREMQRIHETALTLLETVGLAQAIPSCVEAMTAKGCWLN
ncbi:MAG: trimethylamine methyltransferase family protein, partial [Aestuariivirga sp.]|nr:trimethylamine methyltransferase family protein [Aestuariivirga sp.]